MKASQKGTRLNDVRYFRQPRPYTRKRIPKIRLFPDLPGFHETVINTSEDQIAPENNRRNSGKSRTRSLTVHCDQRSREIAWISYTSDSEEPKDFHHTEENNQKNLSNISGKNNPETQIFICQSEPPNLEPQSLENSKFETKLGTEKEVQVKMELKVSEKNVGVEKIDTLVPVTPEVSREFKEEIKREVDHEIPQICSNKNGSDSEKSFWLRYGRIRKILDFFGHLLGKREAENHDNEAIVETRQFVDKGVNNSSGRSKIKKLESSTKNREKKSSRSKSGPRKMETAMKPEVVEFPGLRRQIINSRDKRLRATLIEHEIRARKLEEENRRYRRILEEKLKTRQMSSPLH